LAFFCALACLQRSYRLSTFGAVFNFACEHCICTRLTFVLGCHVLKGWPNYLFLNLVTGQAGFALGQCFIGAGRQR